MCGSISKGVQLLLDGRPNQYFLGDIWQLVIFRGIRTPATPPPPLVPPICSISVASAVVQCAMSFLLSKKDTFWSSSVREAYCLENCPLQCTWPMRVCAIMPTHQSLGCSHEWHTNRHLSQHTVTMAQTSLCKCADSPEPSLLAHKRNTGDFRTVKMCRLARAIIAHINDAQIAIWASTWGFGAYRTVKLCNVLNSNTIHIMTIEILNSQRACQNVKSLGCTV